MKFTRAIACLTCSLGLVAWMGCFKSSTLQGSSESSWKSSRSFSKSLSSSSPSRGDESAYERDIRDFTVAHAASGGDVRSFQRDLSSIAERHGVTDWEREEETYVGIGRGLAKAGVSQGRLEHFSEELSRSDAESVSWIRSGYERASVR